MRRTICYILFFSLSYTGFSQNIDLKVLKSLNKKEMRIWDEVMWGFSASIFPVMPLTVTGIFANGYSTNNRLVIRNGYKAAFTIGFASLTSTAIKFSVNRKRPKARYPEDIIERDRAGRFSFPSGHTTSAFATATALTLTYPQWYVAVPAYAYAGIVGYSRMRLGMHFPSDVLGGIFIGVGTGFLVWKLDEVFSR